MLPYATPEWLAAVCRCYEADHASREAFRGLNVFVTFRVLADPSLGIDPDMYFSIHWADGLIKPDSVHLSREEAYRKSDFILAAPFSVWKQLILKETGFVSAFMTGKVKMDKGSGPGIMALAGKTPAVIDMFHNVQTEWPDGMAPRRLAEYRTLVLGFRKKLRV